MKRINWDIVVSGFSWLIVVALFYAVGSLIAVPPSGAGPVSQLVGIKVAQMFWIFVYSSEAVGLLIAKLNQRKVARKRMLLVIYLTGIFVSVLSFSISGLSARFFANLVFTVSSAICWLYWKFKTEYVSHGQFKDDIEALRSDRPGS